MTISKYAKTYTERYGWHLVPIEPMRKFPAGKNWGEKTLNDPASAYAFWEAHPDYNMGVELGTSGMCSLDIDDAEGFAIILDEFGIDIAELDQYPTIQGKGKRLMFRVPDGAELPYCKVNWSNKNDPNGEKHRSAMRIANDLKNKGDAKREKRVRAVARRWQAFTVVELRAGTDGKQRQDCVVPSIHPETGRAYEWIVKPPATLADWPEPPAWLLAIWQNFDKFKPQMQDACPWVERPIFTPTPKQSIQRSDYPDVDGAYNQANDIHAALTRYGYQRKGKRYLSPHSGTGLAGVHILDSERCYIHHASDPLCSVEGNNPVSSFDLYVEYEHNGDRSKAFKQAAQDLGINLSKPKTNPPSASVSQSGTSNSTAIMQQPSALDLSPLIHTNPKGNPINHIDNLREICNRAGVTVRYNLIRKEEEILIPNKSFSRDNEANAALAWLASECSLFSMPTSKLDSFITYIADANQFNPVHTFITSSPWDGVDRITDLCNTVTASDEMDTNFKNTLIRKWLLSAVRLACSSDNVSARGVLTFQGVQSLGKTKWLKSLVPKELNLVTDGLILKLDDKDSIKSATSFWIVELGELDSTFKKSDIAALKAYITKESDLMRLPYARKDSHFKRRTVYFASVNEEQFLQDKTGNSRYWTIKVKALDSNHNIDMQQVWAQVYETMYLTDETHYLTADEEKKLSLNNTESTSIDPIEELVQSSYKWESDRSVWRWETATNILLELGYNKPNRGDAMTASNVIKLLNGNQTRRVHAGRQLLVPYMINKRYYND